MFRQIVEFTPAFDKRNSDQSKNYGIHGVEMRCVLKGPKGAVQFVLYTHWHLPHVKAELLNKCEGSKYSGFSYCSMEPSPADIGYHSPTPMYDGQGPASESCEYLDGKPCYYDGSSLAAESVFQRLVKEGHNGLWDALKERYHSLFAEEKQ